MSVTRKVIERETTIEHECSSCDGTGLYRGFAEDGAAAVVCRTCEGSGCKVTVFKHKDFTGRKLRKDVKRVYVSQGIGITDVDVEVDGKIMLFSKEGVSYQDWLDGKEPEAIRWFQCPLRVDQGANRIDRCGENVFNMISDCPHYGDKLKCWELLDVKNEETNV